jgi:hypothetical protein
LPLELGDDDEAAMTIVIREEREPSSEWRSQLEPSRGTTSAVRA